MIKKIGVLTSGGDAPGMNACLRAIVRSGLVQGLEIYAIKDGYRGLIDDDIEKMTRHSVSDILNRGGTCIGTARLPEFKNPDVQKKGVEILKSHGIDALVAIGGDGTYQGAQALHKWGFDTALNTIVECVDRLKDTSTSHQRCSVIEVMGHFCGDLSAYAGIACGSELTIINEQNISEDEIIENLKVEKAKGKRHAMVIISEKVLDVFALAKRIENEVGFETRAEVLGHMQRGGSPTAFDRVLASRLGDYAVELLLKDISGVAVGIKNGQLTYTPIENALSLPRESLLPLIELGARLK